VNPNRTLDFRPRLGAVALLVQFYLMATVFVRPARGQEDPSGEWSPRFDEDQRERLAGAEIGDYLGLPINAAARLRVDSWDATLVELPENQCRQHGSDYGWRGPSQLSIWKEVDRASQKVIAYHTHLSAYGAEQTIWMDGRIRRIMRLTPGRDFRPANGKATFSWSTRRI
jgi:hypothetical protein